MKLFNGIKNFFKKRKEIKIKKKEKEKEEEMKEIQLSKRLVCLLGPSGVGKTIFFKVYRRNTIRKNIVSSIGIDVSTNNVGTITLIDTFGNPDHLKALKNMDIIHKCHMFLYLYDYNKETYDLNTIKTYINIISY